MISLKHRFPAFVLCLLLICSIFIPISLGGYVKNIPYQPVSKSRGNTLYVGGGGPDNYTKIQDAIDNASDGDTVYVFDGIYYENLIVDTSNISLIGVSKENTIIDGDDNNDVIRVKRDGLIITGFTIQNSGIYQEFIAGIYLQSNNNSISDNNIRKNKIGVIIQGDDNSILNNFFELNNYEGILIMGIENDIADNIIDEGVVGDFTTSGISIVDNFNLIKGNTITNYENGITLMGMNNIIQNNNLSNNEDGISIGDMENSITSNNIINNQNGITCLGSSRNIINKNNFINNNNVNFYTTLLFIILGNWNDNWTNNYYNDYNGERFYLIRGYCLILFYIKYPWFDIDWNPASEPYDIEV